MWGRIEGIGGYAAATAAVSLATVVIEVVNRHVLIPDISLLYLPAILLVAVYFGTWPSLLAATLAVLEYDFFLLQPLFTFTIAQAQDILAFVIFVIVAVLTSQLAAAARARAEAAQRRAAESSTLYELGQALMSARDVDDVLHVITRQTVNVFEVEQCAIFTPVGDRLQLAVEAARRPGKRDRSSLAAAAYVFRHENEVGIPGQSASSLPGQRLYVPLRTGDQAVGVMEVGPKRSGEALSTEERRLMTSFAAQAALVIARKESEDERRRLDLLEESDRLKSSLLSAVSHDLRTPLASIKASATALLLADASWTAAERQEFLEAIDHEADRLNRLVGNLLDLTRMEAGVLRPVLDWYTPQELMENAVLRLRPVLGNRPLEVSIDPDISAVQLDLVRIEALLVNLVENAVKYSTPGTPIAVTLTSDESGLQLAVADHGPGIPSSERVRVFDHFHRLSRHGDHNPGTGLGLAICRGIVEAHKGTIAVTETPGGGATFVVRLPPQSVECGVPA